MYYAMTAITTINARRVIKYCDARDPDLIETRQILERSIERLNNGKKRPPSLPSWLDS